MSKNIILTDLLRERFLKDGFLKFSKPEELLDASLIEALNKDLHAISQGNFPTGVSPDKCPANSKKLSVLQWVNIWKASSAFRSLVHSPQLATIVNSLACWNDRSMGVNVGTRVVQDQVWVKPPGAPPLVFHRDSPYFFFDKPQVVTVWIALDDMDAELGPLEYVIGSHKWTTTVSNSSSGRATQFFQKDVKYFLHESARENGIDNNDIKVVSMAGTPRGGFSIHDGNTWHGSMKNNSDRMRRGIGIHYVPGNVQFTESALHSKLWRNYCRDSQGKFCSIVAEESFPVFY